MLSERAGKINPSVTVELTARVAQLRSEGIDIIGFNVGEPDFMTPSNISNAAKEAIDSGFTKYTAVAGIVELRQAICEKLKNDNKLIYSPAEISVGTGAKQSLVNAILTICGEDDEVILPTPCWVSYIEMIKLACSKPILVETKEENGFALDIEDIEKSITKKTKAILINTPNNPTGAVYSKEQLLELGKLAVKNDFYIISDEVYEKLIYDDEEHISIGSLSPEIKEKTITINGFSKAYAMTGWRMGYAAGSLNVIKGINAIQSHMTSGANAITQKASIEALLGEQATLKYMIYEFDKRRQYLYKRLNDIEGIDCAGAKGAFYLMPNFSKFFGKKYDGVEIKNSIDMAEFILNKAHVAVVPGDAFESPENIRFAYSNSFEKITEGMDRIEKALKLLK